jgi:hypothetical protein
VTAEGEELTISTARELIVGRHYVIFTNPLSVHEREMFNLTALSSGTFATQGCGIFDVERHDVRVLGRGRSPE